MDGPELEILYQDEHCLVVNKPPGILTQAPPGIDSLEVRVREWLHRQKNQSAPLLAPKEVPKTEPEDLPTELQNAPSASETSSGETKKLYLGLPHRLDRPVSGAIVFALTRRAARHLSAQFERRKVKKLYWACVEGRVEPTEGTWKDFVRKVPDQPRAEIVPLDHPEALYAVLRYRVLGYLEWGSWLEIQLDTGRYHQIRIQAASRGHPVLGDVQYGARQPFGPPVADPRQQPIALHARTLVFRHPKSKETLIIRAALPECWKQLHLPNPICYPASDPPCSPWEELF